MFTGFEESDFSNLRGHKRPSEIKDTVDKLKELKEELEDEITKRWNDHFESNIGGLFPYTELIYNVYVAFTQKRGRSYIPYPQLNISTSLILSPSISI